MNAERRRSINGSRPPANQKRLLLHGAQAEGRRKAKWLPTGIQAVGKINEKRVQDMLLETRCSYKEHVIHSAEVESVRMTNTILFSYYMLSWLLRIKNSVEEVTYAEYERVVTKRIVPYFQKTGITLGNLTVLDIERFYEYCFNILGRKGGTIQHYHANLHEALKYAVKHNLIAASPMEKMDRPKSQKFVGSFNSVYIPTCR